MAEATQIRRGVALAAAAALAFGATVPLLKRASAGVGVFAAGSLLYLGAAAAAGLVVAFRRRPGAGGAPRAGVLARLIGVALLGAVCAPAFLIAGVKRTDAVTTSLLLTLEAPFTMLLARLLFHEHLGRRALAAAALVLAGALVVAVPAGAVGPARAGAAFVAAAMLAWALDNILSRTLADRDPLSVVASKGVLGGLLSAAAAVLLGEGRPPVAAALAIAGIGAVGYGLSLLLYLRAQSLVGAARTASVFAAAPFVGSVVALALGEPWPGAAFAAAAALMIAGVWLHASERHGHRHHHAPLRHEHLHTHDDGHHTHTHDPMPAGPHTHVHDHEAVTHEHEHSEDLHHRHHDH
ncbi:MAG TPA: EamA family transporter [Polyangia bacterium]|jgi:drug/metabolite transporter (DMT)-like permease